jgi:probable rRNA maturation factor
MALVNRVNIVFKKKIKAHFKPEETALYVLSREGKTGLEINLVFTDNTYIKKINLEYRMKNSATDVISFGSLSGGDILISVDRAKEQAVEYGVSLEEELNRLLIHGVLHVTGYDHIKSSDRVKMEAKEKKYLKKALEKK